MGKSPKPINIYVTDRSYLEWAIFQELHAKGNPVRAIQLKPNTIVLGAQVHRLLPGMEKYVDVAIKSARIGWTPTVTPSRPPQPKRTPKPRKAKSTVETTGNPEQKVSNPIS